MNLNKKNFFVWACDYDDNTGEGKLARLYINYYFKYDTIEIFTPFKIFINRPLLQYRYITPFLGIVFCWMAYFKKRRIVYINYLPFWNFLIFLLLPPKTIIGPITGGAKYKNSKIRKFLFPVFYKISEIIVYFRYKNIIFATDLLKDYLNNNFLRKADFNFILRVLKNKKTNCIKKEIDFLIYYRNHPNKKKFFPFNFIKKLIAMDYNVCVFGDKLFINRVKNLGKISNKTVNKLLAKTHYSIASGENNLSIFTLECINNKVKILTDSKFIIKHNQLKNNFIYINYSSVNLSHKLKF